METKASVRNVTEQELVDFNKDFQEVLTKHALEVRTVPNFVRTTEGKFVVDCTMVVYKKVEEKGVESPYKDAEVIEENTNTKTEESSSGDSEKSAE